MASLITLTRYKAWADEQFYTAVAEVPEAERDAPRPIVFGSLLRTLHHVYAMDAVWRAHLLGQPHGYLTRNPADCPAFEDLWRMQQDIDAWYVDYAATLDGRERDRSVEFEFIGGGHGAMTRAEILLHVVNHTTYHRGHAADILYHLSRFPPTTDLPVFLRQQGAVA